MWPVYRGGFWTEVFVQETYIWDLDRWMLNSGGIYHRLHCIIYIPHLWKKNIRHKVPGRWFQDEATALHYQLCMYYVQHQKQEHHKMFAGLDKTLCQCAPGEVLPSSYNQQTTKTWLHTIQYNTVHLQVSLYYIISHIMTCVGGDQQ